MTFTVVGIASRKCSYAQIALLYQLEAGAIHVHCEEADGGVLGVKRILVVRIVIDAAQHQTFRQGAEEQVIVRVRPSARGNGVHLAVDGSHRILHRALFESLDMCHLHGRIQGGLLCK